MALVSALLCLVFGFALVSLGWTRHTLLPLDLLLRASLSCGFGLGVFSVVFFFTRVFGVTNLFASDLVALAVFVACFFLLRTYATTATSLATRKEELGGPKWLHSAVTMAFTVALCAALYDGITRTLAHPHGDGWDAFAIWNLHARFLFRGGSLWRDGFSPLIPWSHPDYPLLLPAAIAHFWALLGNDAQTAPAIIGLVFTFSTVAMLWAMLALLRGRSTAMIAGLALLTTPSFIEQGTSQYADVPLAFFYLAAISLLCLHDHRSGGARSPGLLILAGLAAGFAAWTKNEGLLFLGAMALARLLISIRSKTRRDVSMESLRPRWMALWPLLAGMAPAFLLVACFKHFIAPPGDLFSDPVPTLHKLLDPARYWAVVQWYVKGFFRFGNWLLIPGTVLLVGFYFAVREANEEVSHSDEPGFLTSVVGLSITLAGYFAIYLITPYDIYWHLHFSLTRLFLQLWPGVIFLFFRAVPDSFGPVTVSK